VVGRTACIVVIPVGGRSSKLVVVSTSTRTPRIRVWGSRFVGQEGVHRRFVNAARTTPHLGAGWRRRYVGCAARGPLNWDGRLRLEDADTPSLFES
jgi:hypothetical protein